MASLIATRYPTARHVADVAGGQGMLSRILRKRHNIDAEVIDPRGWTLRGVASREETFVAEMAEYYDLIVGLHPDEALRPVVEAARLRPVIVLPCCNYWSAHQKLGRDALLTSIEQFHMAQGGSCDRVVLGFRGPHNYALVLSA